MQTRKQLSRYFPGAVLMAMAIISLLMHSGHLSKDIISIHSWRQTQTQSTIDNFYEEDMNIFNPRKNDRGDTDGIFRMEFPLAQWTVALAYTIFGQHLIISRLMMFIFGLLSVWGLYQLLDELFRKKILALMGAWALSFSPSFFYYTINPLPDNLALAAAIWGLVFFFRWESGQRGANLIWSGLLLATAALCKLPFIIYFVVPGYYFLRAGISEGIGRKVFGNGLRVLGFALLPLAWYVYVIPGWDENIILSGMLNNEDPASMILDYLQHNLISTFPELLLNYGSLLFFLAGLFFLFRRKAYRDGRFPMILALCILALLYFFFELNAIAKVHDYYLFPFLPLIFMITAYGAYRLYDSGSVFFRYFTLVLLVVLPITCSLRMKARWDEESPGFNRDLLVHKEALREAVPGNALVVAGNDASHFIFFYYIDKKGWGFHNDELSPAALDDMVNRGAEYLYCDTRAVDGNPGIAQHLDSLVLERESIRVFRLK